MYDTITPVRSLDLDRQHTATPQIRITPADRLSVRFGLWLLLRAERRFERERDENTRARARHRERVREAHENDILQLWKSGLHIH